MPEIVRTSLSGLCVAFLGTYSMANAEPPHGTEPTLRALAVARRIEIGANFPYLVEGKSPNNWTESPTIALEKRIAATHFTMMSAGWEMYPGYAWTGPERYHTTGADTFVAWCQAHDIRVHGHGLGYASRVNWLKKLPSQTPEQRAELRSLYARYVTATAAHFRGRVAMWDVCNEQLLPAYVFKGPQTNHSYWKAFQDDPQRPLTGIEWYRQTFRLAREADPSAKLILLDFNNEVICPKSNGMLELVTQLKRDGAPIDGVGFQMHLATDLNRSKGHGLASDADYYASFENNLNRFASLGLDLWITEMDVRINPQLDLAAELERQADIYGRVVQIAVACPRLRGLKFWGLIDRTTWNEVLIDRPNLFDEHGQPKPAFSRVRAALADRLPPLRP